MTYPRSLAGRLILYWLVGSLIAFFTVPATVYLPFAVLRVGNNTFMNLESYTTQRARRIVIEAIRRSPDGALHIEETADLRSHVQRNPGFRFAVFDPVTGALVPGSSRELASLYTGLIARAEVFGSLFHVLDDPNPESRGYVRTANTPFGKLGTIVYGADFHWDDVIFQIYANLTFVNFMAYLPLCGVLSIVALIVVRNGLEPLRSSARKLAEIDLNSLNQRVHTSDLPNEIVPFVNAVNTALKRVDDGVARQRRFTANSAHELRTPITILRTQVEKLDEAPLKHDIQRTVRRIQTVLEQLLVLAQLEERGVDAAPPILDISEAVLTVMADYMPIALDNGRHLKFEAPPDPVNVFGYRWALESVVMNLVENAVRAEPSGGTVIVRVKAGAMIEVVDHGEGVVPTERELIFEPFWRKCEATPGTGLGLAIARELISKQGGRVWVEETPHGGATFKISLPSEPSPADNREAQRKTV